MNGRHTTDRSLSVSEREGLVVPWATDDEPAAQPWRPVVVLDHGDHIHVDGRASWSVTELRTGAVVDGEIHCIVGDETYRMRTVLDDGPQELMISDSLVLNFTVLGLEPCCPGLWERL